MATAKLWWNGSSWSASQAYWVNQRAGSTSSDYAVIYYKVRIIAYDDATISLIAELTAGRGTVYGNPFISDGTKTVKSGGTTLGTGSFTRDVTNYSSFSYSGNVYSRCWYNGTEYYGATSYTSGSTTITNPFRTITYNANGGTGAPASWTTTTGTVTLSSTIPTRTGYTFLGWSTSDSATTASYAAGGSYSLTDDVTFYAVWQANSYNLSISAPATATISILKNGTAYTGNTVNYDDVLTITATPSAGFRIVSLTVNGAAFVSGSTHTVTGDVAISATTIAQSSTIASYDNVVSTLDTFHLTVNRYSTDHYNILRYYDSNSNLLYTSAVFAESTSLVIPQSWFTNFGSVTSITITATNTTYTDPSGTPGTETGVTDSCTFTVTADASMKPVLGTGCIVLSEYNNGTGAANLSDPGYVKGYSKVQAIFDTTKITHATGASAATYSITVQGITTTGSLTTLLSNNTINAAGTLTITYAVTDSRGRSASATETISVNDYSEPNIASFNCYRSDVSGTEDENENYFAVKATCSYTALDDNAITIEVFVQPTGGSYTSYGNLTNGVQSVIGGAFAPDTTYIVKVVVEDTVGNSAYTELTMPRRSWDFHLKHFATGAGAAFGKMAEIPKAVQIPSDWDYYKGSSTIWQVLVDLIYPVGSIYMSVNSTSPATLFGGTWVQIEDTFLLAAGTNYSAGATGGEASHVLTADELAAHTHGSKSLTGHITFRDMNISDHNLILDAGGIASWQQIAWSGGHYGAEKVSFSSYYQNQADIDASHEHDSVGLGDAHNNMPPYLAVYVWKRTA